MSGNGSRRPNTPDGFVTPDDVQRELNIIEDLRAAASGQDEYLEAMLTNQRIMLMQMQQQMQVTSTRSQPISAVELDDDQTPAGYNVSVRPVPTSELRNEAQVPLDAIGVTNRGIQENDTGSATFQVNGTVFATTVRITEDTPSGEPIRVEAPGNICSPVNDVALGLLGLPGSIGADGFDVSQTDQNVTIAPGETKTVLRVTGDGLDWVSVGTNDETHSLYQYYVDGDAVLETPNKEPLGLYNDMYDFPSPISADGELEVRVTRQQSASGSADYYSKIAYFG